MEQKDYYKILGADRTADPKRLKDAYRELALKYHPDRNVNNPENIEKMKLVNEAYAVLSNPDKRKEYDLMKDRFGPGAYSRFRNTYTDQDIFSGSDILGVFEELAKAFNLRGCDDVFREFYGSGYKKFEVRQPGFYMKGFVFTGPFGRKKAEKPETPKIAAPGPLGKLSQYVFKKLTGAEIPVAGADVEDFVNITPETAREGGPYAYYHKKKAKKLIVKVPAGVRDGQRIRLAGMGEDGKGGGKPGDLYLKVRVKKPVLARIKDFIADLTK